MTTRDELQKDHYALYLEQKGLEEEIKEALELIESNKIRLDEIKDEFENLKDASYALKTGDTFGLKVCGY